MKTIGRTITTLSFIVMLLAGWTQAQYAIHVLRVNVPFEFSVGGKTLTAGKYSVVRTAPYIVVLRDARERTVATLITRTVRASTSNVPTKLDFQSDGGQHTLVRIWFGNSEYGLQLSSPRPRVALAKAQSGKDQNATQP